MATATAEEKLNERKCARLQEIECLKQEIAVQREKREALNDQMQSYRKCLDNLKHQVAQLTAANERYRRERDQLTACNAPLQVKIRELEKEVCRQRAAIECMRERLFACY